MIEFLNAENGSVVLREEGRLLASAFDPEGEARDWVLRRDAFLDKVKTVFVLGSGAGYHIAELLRVSSASILVIEYSNELMTAVVDLQKFDEHRVHFENVQRAAQLRTSTHVKSAVSGSFVVLAHAPSTRAQAEFYRECHELLLGRDWPSLNWQWKLKGFNPLNSEIKPLDREATLTIHDLEGSELVQNSQERERILVKALRELVK